MKQSRRSLLKSTLSAGLGMAAPTLLLNSAHSQTDRLAQTKTLKLGFNIPKTGPYAQDGEDQLRALKLAVRHLNGEGDGGLINTLKPLALKGNGVLGKKVEFVVGDTETNAQAALKSAEKMIHEENVAMITGGVASDVAIAVQDLCQREKVLFMVGLSHSNDTTGKDRKRYGFRHFFNAHMSAQALKSVLHEELGHHRRVAHLTSDYTWGWTQEDSMRQISTELGWQTVSSVRTPLGQETYQDYLKSALLTEPDVLVLNHYSGDMVRSLTQAAQMGLRERIVNGRNFKIIVPLLSRLIASDAGQYTQGVIGTVNWHWTLQDEGSRTFVRSFLQTYGQPPSQAAHTCYVQTLLYANACETIGTFYPPSVIAALEGLNFDGMGNGPTLYRSQDHQCFKDVLVVRGHETPPSDFDLLDIVKQVPAKDVTYAPDFFPGQIGSS